MTCPPELIKDLEDAFFLFSYDDSKKVRSKELGPVIRSVGLNPTEEELKGIMAKCDAQGGNIDVNGLTKILGGMLKQLKTTPEELTDALLVFDKFGNRTISVADLMHALTCLGERLPREIVDKMVREVDADGEGQVSIDEVSRLLLAK